MRCAVSCADWGQQISPSHYRVAEGSCRYPRPDAVFAACQLRCQDTPGLAGLAGLTGHAGQLLLALVLVFAVTIASAIKKETH